MPTFDDPGRDATEASDALRGLAHATRRFEDPAETYPVLGELLASTRALTQVLEQVATAQTAHLGRARDEHGNTLLGAHAAQAAATQLRRASALLHQAETHLDAATSHSGRIAWAPPPVTIEAEPARRWISVAFLQGTEANEVLDLIDTDGPEAAIEHLSGFDHGAETTDAAMEDGHVYDHPPAGPHDQDISLGDYRMVHNHALSQVGIYREHRINPADQLPEPPSNGLSSRPLVAGVRGLAQDQGVLGETTAPARTTDTASAVGGQTGRAARGSDWFSPHGTSSSHQQRVIEL